MGRESGGSYWYDYDSTCAVIAARRRGCEIRVGLWAHRLTYKPWQEPSWTGLPGFWEALACLYPEDASRVKRLAYYTRARAGVFGLRLPPAERRHFWGVLRPLLRQGLPVWEVEPAFDPSRRVCGLWLKLKDPSAAHGRRFAFLGRHGLLINVARRQSTVQVEKLILRGLKTGEITREEAEAELVLFALERSR